MCEEKGDKKVEDKLIDLEAKLLEQEHRPYALVKNFIGRKKYPKGDKRRLSIKLALLWRLLFSPAAIAATGGLLGILSTFFLWQQTKFINNQNLLIKKQNVRIEQQTHLVEASRRSSQVFILGEILRDLNGELENPNNIRREISKSLQARIIGISSAMKPYKYLENDSLIPFALSPERGQLLVALLESNIKSESDLGSNPFLEKCDFTSSDLKRVNLLKKDFSLLNLNFSNFNRAKLKECIFYDATIQEGSFVKTNILKGFLLLQN
jgi:hypothetical protein